MSRYTVCLSIEFEAFTEQEAKDRVTDFREALKTDYNWLHPRVEVEKELEPAE